MWWDEHLADGYDPVYTPHVSREALFAVSGHLDNYGDMMYAFMALDELPYRVKPMNCPGHVLIYKDRGRSYRELPLRWGELGTVYRYEQRPGVVHGMLRVRGFTQDDAHIFCLADQLAEEIAGVCRFVDRFMKTFGFEYTAYLATRPAEKTIGEDAIWDRATEALQQAADSIGLTLELDEGAAAPSTGRRSTTRSRTPWGASGRTAPSSATSTCPSASTSPTPRPTDRSSARSWCTARSSAASSASSAC